MGFSDATMKEPSHLAGFILLIVALLFGGFMQFIPQIFAGPMPVEAAPDLTIAERFRYVGMMFAPLPDWVKRWMAVQHYIFAGSLLFVLWHREAQAYLAAIIASHAASMMEIAFAPVSALSLGLVALNHWLWIPALIVLARAAPSIPWRSGYGAWCGLAIGQLCFSLFFDLRDGVRYLLSFF